jgi:hypothetical protein
MVPIYPLSHNLAFGIHTYCEPCRDEPDLLPGIRDINGLGRLTLITPALFSQPPPRPPGEEGDIKRVFLSPLSLGGMGGRLGERGLGELSNSMFPHRRIAPLMQDRDNHGLLFLNQEVDGIRKSVKEATAYRSTDRRKL